MTLFFFLLILFSVDKRDWSPVGSYLTFVTLCVRNHLLRVLAFL